MKTYPFVHTKNNETKLEIKLFKKSLKIKIFVFHFFKTSHFVSLIFSDFPITKQTNNKKKKKNENNGI